MTSSLKGHKGTRVGGEPSKNHGKTLGKPWENGGLMKFNGILWDFMGFTTPGSVKIAIEHGHRNSGFSQQFCDFPYVKVSEGKCSSFFKERNNLSCFCVAMFSSHMSLPGGILG